MAIEVVVLTVPIDSENTVPEEVGGIKVKGNDGEALPVPQALMAETVILPDVAEVEKSTVMLFVFAPEVMVDPAGNDQLYPVAPATAATEYVTPLCD